MNSLPDQRVAVGRSSNPIRWIIDLFDSIKLGIGLIVVIVLYSAIGSAVPTARQFLELTEFAFFNHWVFVALIGLFCLNLITTTLRRIRFNWINAGVLTVHTGLLMLCAGSVVYFGRKIEGDVYLRPPTINIVSIDRFKANQENASLGRLVAVEGESWESNMPMLGGNYAIHVDQVRHEGMITAKTVELTVRIGDEAPRKVRLVQAGQERFAKLNDRLALWLMSANSADTFYDNTIPVLQVEHHGHIEQFSLAQLPYYHERFTPDAAPVRDETGQLVESSRTTAVPVLEHWKMPIPLVDPTRAIAADWPINVVVDGFLPYAELAPKPAPGGTVLNPLARIRMAGLSEDVWLAALQPKLAYAKFDDGRAAEIRWIEDGQPLDPEWTRPISGKHVLDIWLKDSGIRNQYDVEQGSKIKIEGTPYTLTIEQLQPNWPLRTAGFEDATTPIALVWVESADRAFQRSVVQRFPQLCQDRDREGKKLEPEGGQGTLVDNNLVLRYTDASSDHFLLAIGPNLAPTLVHTAPGGARKVSALKTGETSGDGASTLTLLDYIEKPVFRNEPVVVQERHRRPLGSVGRSKSLIALKLSAKSGDWSTRVWVPFSFYNTEEFDDTSPTVVEDVPGMGSVRFVYGRMKWPLATNMTLERLETLYYPGQEQAREWTSYFRYEDRKSGTVRPAKAFLNNTATIGDWTFFQSQANQDGKSHTVLGVGNRQGVMTMLIGCALISLGMAYAFCMKPILVRRRKARLAEMHRSRPDEGDGSNGSTGATKSGRRLSETIVAPLMAIAAMMSLAQPVAAATEDPPGPAGQLLAIQSQLDLETLRHLALVHHWRHATVDSWARDTIKNIYGSRNPWGLDPVAAAVEFMLNVEAYRTTPLIYVKDRGIRIELTAHPVKVTNEEQARIIKTGLVSLDFIQSPAVMARIRELSMDMLKNKAIGRFMSAYGDFQGLGENFTIIPNPKGRFDTPWSDPATATSPSGFEKSGLSADQSAELLRVFRDWIIAWRARDVGAINQGIDRLSKLLPTYAPAGVYPELKQRNTEVTYRRAGLLGWGWVCYTVGFFASIFSLATGYSRARKFALFWLIAGIVLHGAELAMRWIVIGRIPNANMYEALMFAALAGTLLALVLEFFVSRGVFLLAGCTLGFLFLALPEILRDKVDNSLVTMMPILDDVMLRIHTSLIIGSYAVITLAFAAANCYLFVSGWRDRVVLSQATLGAQAGALACLIGARLEWFADMQAGSFVFTLALFIIAGALVGRGVFMMRPRSAALVSTGTGDFAVFPVPQDSLQLFDFCHRILLYIAMVALFVGLVLGAVWADYSWGRPWGWDPKEVFALNTWLIYAVLIHARFVTKRRALWASVLSVVGFAAMQFNWWVVNFYIVGLHSYA